MYNDLVLLSMEKIWWIIFLVSLIISLTSFVLFFYFDFPFLVLFLFLPFVFGIRNFNKDREYPHNFCKNCGLRIPPNSNFCSNCGSLLY
ncbi:MAG: zinc ribbon domain-containing protein [Candidatus Hodarchaeales archaeon]